MMILCNLIEFFRGCNMYYTARKPEPEHNNIQFEPWQVRFKNRITASTCNFYVQSLGHFGHFWRGRKG